MAKAATKEKPRVKQETKAEIVSPPATVGTPSFRIKEITPKGVSGLLQNVRLAWVKVMEPQVNSDNPNKASYQVTALIPEADAKPVMQQVFDAVKQYMPINKTIIDKQERIAAYNQMLKTGENKSLFKRGNDAKSKSGEIYDGHENMITLQIKTSAEKDGDGWKLRVPLKLMDKNKADVPQNLAGSVFFSGCFAHVACTFACYDYKGKGVTVYLNGLMKVADGPRLGASNPFADVEAADGDTPARVDDTSAF